MVMGKAALFVEPYHFEITELPAVPVEAGGIRVKIRSGGICGSDLHFWRGEIKPIVAGAPGPVILGHEMAGVVDAMASDISTDSKGQTSEGGRPGRLLLLLPLSPVLQLPARGAEPLPGPFPVPRIGGGVPVLQRRVFGLLLSLPGALRVQGAGRTVGRGGRGRELRGVAGDRGVEARQPADG